MKVGKLSQTAWNRAVMKQLYKKQEQNLLKISAAESCSAYAVDDEQVLIKSAASTSGDTKKLGNYSLAAAINQLASRGAKPIDVQIFILISERIGEQKVAGMVQEMEEMCTMMNIAISNVQVEVNPAVTQAIVRVETMGFAEKRMLRNIENIKQEQDIVMCGFVGLEGTLRILDEQEKELKGRFVPAFLRQTKELESQMLKLQLLENVEKEVKEENIILSAVQHVGSGGLFATLWDTAEVAGLGLQIDMQKIQIRQETVEICEYYHLNPYKMTSTGSLLFFTDQGEKLIEILEKNGARAVRLGSTTAENARVITSGSEIRYLDRPTSDELMLWRKQKLEEGKNYGYKTEIKK